MAGPVAFSLFSDANGLRQITGKLMHHIRDIDKALDALSLQGLQEIRQRFLAPLFERPLCVWAGVSGATARTRGARAGAAAGAAPAAATATTTTDVLQENVEILPGIRVDVVRL